MERTKRCIGYIIVCVTDWEGQEEQFMWQGYTGYDGDYETEFNSWGEYYDSPPRLYHVTQVKAALERAEKYWGFLFSTREGLNREPHPIEAREVWA